MSWSDIVSGAAVSGDGDELKLKRALALEADLDARLGVLRTGTESYRREVEEESARVTAEERRLDMLEGKLHWEVETQAKLCRDGLALEIFVADGGDLAEIPTVMKVDSEPCLDYFERN